MTSAKFVRSLFVLLAMSASVAALAEQQSVLSVDGKRFGGEGTAGAPGIRWYFEYVRSQRSR